MRDDVDIGALRALLAQKGKLRAAINLGNKALVQHRSEDDEPTGISPSLARELAKLLGVPLEMVIFNGAGPVTKALAEDAWDIAFLAIDPDRLGIIAFTDPYILIEGTYAVRAGSGISSVGDADGEGMRIVASVGSAYELHLRRTLRHAELIPAATPASSMQAFLDGEGDAVAGVRQTLEAFFRGREGFKVLPDRITAIEQAIAVPAAKASATPHLNAFLTGLTRSGFIDMELGA